MRNKCPKFFHCSDVMPRRKPFETVQRSLTAATAATRKTRSDPSVVPQDSSWLRPRILRWPLIEPVGQVTHEGERLRLTECDD